MPPYPDVGSNLNCTATTTMSINPSQKGAIETPNSENEETKKSLIEPALIALRTPNANAVGTARTKAIVVR